MIRDTIYRCGYCGCLCNSKYKQIEATGRNIECYESQDNSNTDTTCITCNYNNRKSYDTLYDKKFIDKCNKNKNAMNKYLSTGVMR